MTGWEHDEIDRISDELFAPGAAHGTSLAMIAVHHGEVVFERYGVQPDTVFGPGGPVDADTGLISWSTAKSITHAALGIAVGDGLLQLDAPAPVPSWVGTEKEAITLQDLVDMRPGLLFVEDYVDDSVSHCIEMLYGSGKEDMATYAADLPLVHPPGTVWNYSSGTTNIISRIVGDAVGDMPAFLADRLFGPLGMHSARPTFDAAGTFVGSSYVHATARDFAKFGELYRDDGMSADGVSITPPGWTDHARTFVATDPDGDFDYGRQWWLWRDEPGGLAAHGYEGQYIIVMPHRALTLVHLGKSPVDQRAPLNEALRRAVRAFPLQ